LLHVPLPPDRREGEHCQVPSPIRHHALSHEALVNDNVVHRHFPWLRPKTGVYRFALPQQYAALGIDTTESEGEPIMCDITRENACLYAFPEATAGQACGRGRAVLAPALAR
jgi:hypothetical protein